MNQQSPSPALSPGATQDVWTEDQLLDVKRRAHERMRQFGIDPDNPFSSAPGAERIEAPQENEKAKDGANGQSA